MFIVDIINKLRSGYSSQRVINCHLTEKLFLKLSNILGGEWISWSNAFCNQSDVRKSIVNTIYLILGYSLWCLKTLLSDKNKLFDSAEIVNRKKNYLNTPSVFVLLCCWFLYYDKVFEVFCTKIRIKHNAILDQMRNVLNAGVMSINLAKSAGWFFFFGRKRQGRAPADPAASPARSSIFRESNGSRT